MPWRSLLHTFCEHCWLDCRNVGKAVTARMPRTRGYLRGLQLPKKICMRFWIFNFFQGGEISDFKIIKSGLYSITWSLNIQKYTEIYSNEFALRSFTKSHDTNSVIVHFAATLQWMKWKFSRFQIWKSAEIWIQRFQSGCTRLQGVAGPSGISHTPMGCLLN